MAEARWDKFLGALGLRNDYSERPAGLDWRSNSIFIVATVAIGMFTDLFLYSLIVPILPFMLQDRVGVPEDQIQAHVSGLLAVYAGSSVISSPIAGILADRVKTRQAPFLLGLTALLAATILLFTGRSVPVLVIARACQGISGGFVWTIGLAICVETVGPQNLGKTIGSMFSFISVGTLMAPPLGGALYARAGYAGVLGVSCAALAVDFVMRLLVIEKRVALKYRAESEGSDSDESSHLDGSSDASSDEEQPLLGPKAEDLSAFKISPDQPRLAKTITILPCLADPALLTAYLVSFIQAVLFGAFDATIPIVAYENFGYDSLQAGFLFLSLGTFDLVLGPFFGWCTDRYGTKSVATICYTYLVPILVLLRFPHEGGLDQALFYAGLLALAGSGLAGIGAPAIVETGIIMEKYYKANPDFFGEAGPYAQIYGLSSMVFSLGLTVGPELAGLLKEAIGYGNMNAVLACVCAVTAVMSFIFFGSTPPKEGSQKSASTDEVH